MNLVSPQLLPDHPHFPTHPNPHAFFLLLDYTQASKQTNKPAKEKQTNAIKEKKIPEKNTFRC